MIHTFTRMRPLTRKSAATHSFVVLSWNGIVRMAPPWLDHTVNERIERATAWCDERGFEVRAKP